MLKRSNHRFSQVHPDYSQEWLNSIGKKGGGIFGIMKSASALRRLALSYNLQAHIAAKTNEMFGLGLDDQVTCNESHWHEGKETVLMKTKVWIFSTSIKFLTQSPPLMFCKTLQKT